MRYPSSISTQDARYTPHLEPAIRITPSPRLTRGNWRERLVGLLCLIVTFPLLAVLMLLVRITSRGPALLRQARVGKDGRIFLMYKLRSMVRDAERETGPTWADERDPRITLFGAFLRKTHLDELPQLINVVRGEMALFGPRPERPELVPYLAAEIPGYYDRLAVLPGITGLAQINFPADRTINCVRRKLQVDLEYIRHASFQLHLRMLLWTLLRLMGVPASLATPWLRLARSPSSLPGTDSSDAQPLATAARGKRRLRPKLPDIAPPITSLTARQMGEH